MVPCIILTPHYSCNWWLVRLRDWHRQRLWICKTAWVLEPTTHCSDWLAWLIAYWEKIWFIRQSLGPSRPLHKGCQLVSAVLVCWWCGSPVCWEQGWNQHISHRNASSCHVIMSDGVTIDLIGILIFAWLQWRQIGVLLLTSAGSGWSITNLLLSSVMDLWGIHVGTSFRSMLSSFLQSAL